MLTGQELWLNVEKLAQRTGAKKVAENSLKTWFSKNGGKGWVDCKTGKPCGRKSRTKSKRGYPACRPTMAECKSKSAKTAAKKKTSSKKVNWKPKRKKA